MTCIARIWPGEARYGMFLTTLALLLIPVCHLEKITNLTIQTEQNVGVFTCDADGVDQF